MLGKHIFDVAGADLTPYYTYVGGDCPRALRCPSCQDPFLDPVELGPCRHTVCMRCVQGRRGSAPATPRRSPSKHDGRVKPVTCPVCNCESDETSLTALRDAHPLVTSQLDEMVVKCTECQLQMQRQFFSAHFERQCEYRIVRCPNANCTQQVVRKELADHLANCSLDDQYDGATETQVQLTPRGASRMLSPVGTRWNTPAALAAEAAFEGNNAASFFSGVIFEYYQGAFDDLPDFDTLEPSYAGVVGGFGITEGTELAVFNKAADNERTTLDAGNFAVRFSAYLDVPQEGLYTFYLSSNDGSALYIDGQRIVDNGGQHYSTTVEGQVQLAKGRCQIQVHFFHKSGKMMEGFRGGASLVVQYSCRGPYWPLAVNSIPKQIIPESALVYSVQDPYIRSELMKSLRKRQMKKADREEDAGRRTSAEACTDPRELQLQLEISQATIRSLQASVYNLTVESDLKLQAMRRELEEERSRTARMAEAMRDILNFGKRREEEEEVEYASAERRDREREVPTAEACEEEENEGFGPDREVEQLVHQNFDDVRKLKQMYFCSLALSIKMNSLCFDRRRPSAPNGEGATNIQELFELYESGPDVPIERWPKFISEHLQL